MFFGFYAIVMATTGQIYDGYCDDCGFSHGWLDGRVARLTQTETDFGGI